MDTKELGWKGTAERLRRVVAVIASVCFLAAMPPALAEGDDVTRTIQYRANGHARPVHRGLNLDLTSQAQNIRVGSDVLGNGASAVIDVAGATRTVQAGDRVTAAEFVALQQQLGGAQSLILDNAGRAASGTFSIDSVAAQANANRLTNLVVPAGVTATNNFVGDSTLNVRGNLTNLGTLLGYSNADPVAEGTFAARNINNMQGALISSVLPDSLAANLANVVDNFSLNLVAVRDIFNAGTITSAGTLSMTAGGTITNASGGNVEAVMSAANNINLYANSVVNSGLIQSLNNNINFATNPVADILINNTGGRIEALLGTINVRDVSYSGANDINLLGGDYLSRELNLYSGQGSIEVNVGQITGEISSIAGSEHITAASDNLVLGTHCITGDPTYYNTAGSITINGPITVAEALTIVARDNITGNMLGASYFITARNGAGVGQPVTLVAGANITSTAGGSDQSTVPPLGSGNGLTFNGASANGGQVSLNRTNPLFGGVIDTSSTAGNNAGGAITIAAFGGSDASSGTVMIHNDSVSGSPELVANGAGTGAGGAVRIIGGQNGNSITVFRIESKSAQGNGGAVTITAAQPAAGNVTFAANGNLTAGSITPDLATRSTAGSVVVASINTRGGQGPSGAEAGNPGIAGGAGGAITLRGTTGLRVLNVLLAEGGFGGNGTTGNPTQDGGMGGAGGAGGAIALDVTSGLMDTEAIVSNGGGGGPGGNGGAGVSFGMLGIAGGNGGGGGAGGTAGVVTLSSTAGNIITEAVFAIGGAGGQGGNGGASGGFGSLPGAGGAGGGGGAGNAIAITTVNAGGIFVDGELNSSGGMRGSGGTGLPSGAFGPFGQPGPITVRTTTSLANPGAPVAISTLINAVIRAVAGDDNLANISAGAGAIILSGSSVVVAGFTNVGGTAYSIYGGSSQQITAAGASLSSSYSADGDLSSLTTAPITINSSPFLAVHGAFSENPLLGNNGTSKALATRTGGTITINGVTQSNPLTSSTSIPGGTARITVQEGSGTRSLANGDLVTPAELVAAIQVHTEETGQSLTLNGSGQAVGGGFWLRPANQPVGGSFTTIVLPANVTENVAGTVTVNSTGSITINGTMNFPFSGVSGAMSAAGNISGSGLIITAHNFTITSTGGRIGGGGSTLTISAVFAGKTLTLITAGQDIGSQVDNVVINYDKLQATTGGGDNNSSVFITNTRNGTVTLVDTNRAGTGASGTFFLNANNGTSSTIVTGAGATVGAANIVLNATQGNVGSDGALPGSAFQITGATNLTANAANGSVFVNSDDSIDLRNSSFGGYTNTANADFNVRSAGGNITDTTGATIAAANLVLTATTGNIGTSGQRITTSAPMLTANAANGNAFLNATDATGVTLGASSANSAGGTFNLLAANEIVTTAAGTISSKDVVLTSTNNGLSLLGTITGVNSVSLTSAADIDNDTFGAVATNELNLTSTMGSIGTSSDPLQTAFAKLSLNAGTAGSVFATQTGAVILGDSTAGVDFHLTSTAATSLNSISTDTGFITVANNAGLLQVMPGKELRAGGGDLTLQNNDQSAGQIALGANSILVAEGTLATPRNVFIVIGPVPGSPMEGVAPLFVSATESTGGQIFWGANSVFTTAPTNGVAAKDGGRVVFNTGTRPNTAISLNGGVRIGTPFPLVRNLNLSDPVVAQSILALQTAKILGGKLKLDNITGAAVGGKLILFPFNLASSISAENIPLKVSIQLKDFSPSQSLVVQLTSGDPVVINGKQDFVGKTAGGAFIINSVLDNITVLNLGATGSLKSKTGYTINADGNVTLNGKIQANNLTITTTPGSNGSISVGNAIGKKGSATTTLLDADGTGSITSTAITQSLLGGVMTLRSDSGNIGSSAAHIKTTSTNLTLISGGTGTTFVDNKGNLTLQPSGGGGDFRVSTTGTFNVNNISTVNGSIELVATGGGTLTVMPGSTVAANGSTANLTLQHVKSSSKGIFLGTNSTLLANASTAGSGNVTIFVGPAPALLDPGTAPLANIDEDITPPGAIFYGTNGIVANGPDINIITAKGANVIFSTGTSSASGITLNGGVDITADPPASLVAPLVVHTNNAAGATSSTPTATAPSSVRNHITPSLGNQAPVTVAAPAGATTPPVLPLGTDVSTNSLIPIACFTGAAASNTVNIEQLTAESAMPAISESGDMLLAPAKDMTIRTAAGELHIAAGSIVLVMSTPEATAIFNLHDTRRGAVKLLCANQDIYLAPGKALILMSGSNVGLPHGHPARSVGYRRVKNSQLCDGSSLISAEFSIPSALQSLNALIGLHSSRVPKDLKVLHQIVKTAAVLSTVRGHAELYRPLAPLQLVSSR